MSSTPEYAAYATKVPTDTMLAFADFIRAEVFGGTLPADLDEATFVKSVALGGSLRMQFQRSDMWRSDPRNYLNGVESRREAKAEEKAEKAKAALVRATERAAKAEEAAEAAKAKAAAKVAELTAATEPTPEPTPVPAPKPTAPKSAPKAA